MALTPSNMLPLGTSAPEFELPDMVSGDTKTLAALRGGKATVVMFICNHCPYVIHVNEELVRLASDYQSQGVSFIAISSNDAETYPQDGPEKMTEHAAAEGYNFPYLYDETQAIAKAYDAACTPDFYVFNADLKLAYRGQLDASRPNSGIPVDGADMRAALDSIVEGKEPAAEQRASAGCNIKWKTN